MKTILSAILFSVMIIPTEKVEDTSMDCDEEAEYFYYDTLAEGGSQQEATDAYGSAFDICWRHYQGSSDLEVNIQG